MGQAFTVTGNGVNGQLVFVDVLGSTSVLWTSSGG